MCFFSGVHPYLLTFCLDMFLPGVVYNFGKAQLKYGKSVWKKPFIHSIASCENHQAAVELEVPPNRSSTFDNRLTERNGVTYPGGVVEVDVKPIRSQQKPLKIDWLVVSTSLKNITL